MIKSRAPLRPGLRRIAVFRALQLGDLLNAVPALRALRAAYPQAHITLVGLPWAEAFANRFRAYVDELLVFPGFPGMPEGEPELEAMPRFLQRAHSAHLDLAIQMHGSGRITNQLITLLGARQTAGFYEPGEFCPDPKTYLQYPVDEPERWRHLRLMEFLGVPLRGDELEFPLGSDDWSELQALRERHHLGGEIVCIHAGARKPERRWPVERFAAVADALAGRGYQIVLTGSSGEAKPVESLALQMRTTPVNVAGKTTLGGLAALLASCRLLITNDTGVSHVATAVKAPSLVLFTADDHERWAPADRALHRLVLGAAAMPASLVLDQAVQQLEAIHAGAR